MRWQDVGLVLFFLLLLGSVHKHSQNELSQYPACHVDLTLGHSSVAAQNQRKSLDSIETGEV